MSAALCLWFPVRAGASCVCCRAALQWAARARLVVCVEPPGGGWAGLAARAAVQGGLPGPHGGGVLYLADVCVPPAVFSELQVSYRPPFGACSVLALHPATDAD